MPNFQSKEYADYLLDQRAETLGAGPDDKYLDHLINNLKLQLDFANIKVLDIGGGKFDSYYYFLDRFNNKIQGIDISVSSIEKAKREGTTLLEVDAHKMQEVFSPESFDLLLSFHSFEHMFDLPVVLKNCFDVLKPGGHLYFSIPMPSENWHRGHWFDIPNNEAMKDRLTSIGFLVLHDEWTGEKLPFRPQPEMVCLCRKPQ